MKTKKVKVSVISDLHLGTHACKAKKITNYLKSIHPEILVLNGDIIDSWRFSRNYFPKSHFKVIRQIIKMLESGVEIYYISGNHDDFLRKFNNTRLGNLKITNQLILELDDQKTWIFHGDVYDHIIQRARWLAKLGAAFYEVLSLLDKLINFLLKKSGKQEKILYKSIKNKFVKDNSQPSKAEKEIVNSAAALGYETIICGHSHTPKDIKLTVLNKQIRYINCGDWVENFTATEYRDGKWELVYFSQDQNIVLDEYDSPNQKKLYQMLIKEISYPNIF